MGHLNRLAIVLATFAAIITSSLAGDIGPGSPAPALEIKSWLKGNPVKNFDKNKIYVVEFWATWCGPCLQSIPHLTELAKKNPDVTFIGVSIWEDDVEGSVGKFVKDMGDKMDYNVAYSGNKDGMAKSWMEPAAQNGIPASFVIKNGQIQWIGHPMSLEGPLSEIKAGTFDMTAFKAKFDKQAETTRVQMAGNKALTSAIDLFKAGKRAEAHAALDKVLVDFPKMAPTADRIKFGWLAQEDSKAWDAKAMALVSSKDKAQIMQVASFALVEAQTDEGADRARHAIDLVIKNSDPKDFNINLYAMNVYQKTKDYQLAMDYVNKLIEMFPTSPAKDSPQFKENLEKTKKELQAKLGSG